MLGVVIDDTDSAERVRAQQAVNAQLARALELAKVSVWRIDLQQRRIHFNDAGYRLAGMAPQAEGMPLDEMRARVHPDDVPIAERAIERAVSGGGVVDAETRVRGPAGDYRHVLTRRAAERDAQGRVVALAGVLLDQTEHVAERDRAQALAQRLQFIADAAGVGIWSVESPGDAAAERVQWNAQMFLIHGLSADAAPPPLHEWMCARLHADDRGRVTYERRRARRAGQAGFETNFRILRPDGSLRWVVCRSLREERGGRALLHGIHLDVTQQHTLAQALQLQEQRLRLATQIAGVGIWERDVDSATVVWEEQMYRLRGLSPDDPRTPREIDELIVPPHALQERRQRIRNHLQDAAPYSYEFEVRWPDGSLR